MAIQELEQFLATTEKPAFRIARMAVHNDADALDIVQDAMMKLVEHYRDKAPEQWPPLFYRILQNRITDFHRGNKRRWQFWKSANDDQAKIEERVDAGNEPGEWLATERLSNEILAEIEALPYQQQQCFLLRGWQGLSEKQTAEAMQLATGTVKTHYARALAKLSRVLEQ